LKKYKHLFFDLDHTLWDYDANAKDTLHELYHFYELDMYGISSETIFTDNFFKVNTDLWDKLDTGEINKFYLRNHRFRLVFESSAAIMKMVDEQLLVEVNKKFLAECPKKSKLVDGALDILNYIQGKYDMHIITNGFEEVQAIKMKHSGLDEYFDKIITSEKAGHKKPNGGIYQYALKHTSSILDDSVMIGDNLKTDIKGARMFGMDQIYFNPHGLAHDDQVTLEIEKLSELNLIL